MAKYKYIDKTFRKATLEKIKMANAIIEKYESDGMKLTLRGLYYQFVKKNLIPNSEVEYKKLGTIISNARLTGMIDWNAIEDRTRRLNSNYHNESAGEAVQSALDYFKLNKWLNQEYRVEVWIEKEALLGVIEKTCRRLDVPFFACKGYNSQSNMWGAGQRFLSYMRGGWSGFGYEEGGQKPVIIYLGDHDPSGVDMTRDIVDRQEMFVESEGEGRIEVKRIALSYEQVQKYNLPPNPTKSKDTRADSYMKDFGGESWELDALESKAIVKLIEEAVAEYTNEDLMKEVVEQEKEQKKALKKFVDKWK